MNDLLFKIWALTTGIGAVIICLWQMWRWAEKTIRQSERDAIEKALRDIEAKNNARIQERHQKTKQAFNKLDLPDDWGAIDKLRTQSGPIKILSPRPPKV